MTAQNKLQKRLALSKSKGFTLIELLVVIGILAVLLAITLIAINPARQFAQANNTQRSSDVNAILNAIGQYAAGNSGNLPDGAGPVALTTCTAAAPCVISNVAAVSPKIDLCSVLTTEYIAELPTDPSTGTGTPTGACATDYNTRYEVYVASGGDSRVTVTAPDTQSPATSDITATR